jgi:anti-sigma regulatory factor (Ser/Thr protein kinase)
MDGPRSWSHETEFAPEPSSTRAARTFVEGHLVDHDLDHLVNDVVLVMSELATNAVQHAGTPYAVMLSSADGSVRLEVRDGSSSGPTLVDASPSDLRGRGLLIVDALSRDWGVAATASGEKAVWAEFDTARPPDRADSAEEELPTSVDPL